MATLLEPKIRNGAKFYDLLITPTTSHLTTATIDAYEKLVFHDSLFTVGLVTNSYKYGSELQFGAFSRLQPTIEYRVDKDHKYYRLESGYLPGTHQSTQKVRNALDHADALIDNIDYAEPTFHYEPKPVLTVKPQSTRQSGRNKVEW